MGPVERITVYKKHIPQIEVLDHGHVDLVDYMGEDLKVVNTARVSYANSVEEMTAKDEKLIDYLAKNKHVSPSYHPQIQLRVKAPISVQREWFKHKIGTAENSESTRYIEVHPEFYTPEHFGRSGGSNKQGAAGTFTDEDTWDGHNGIRATYIDVNMGVFKIYKEFIDAGVAKQDAREMLPLCTYTSWIWTASLMAVIHFIQLRDHDRAHPAIRAYAVAVKAIAQELFPISLKAYGIA